MIEVTALTPALEPAYAAFVEAQASRTIYHTLAFRDFLLRALDAGPRYLVARREGEVVGVLPCLEAAGTTHGRVLNSLPWYGSHGGCLVAQAHAEPARQALLQAYAGLAAPADVAFAALVLPLADQRHAASYAAYLQPDAIDARNSQVTPLPAHGPEADLRLEAVLQQKTRNLARKARKQGFELGIEDSDAAWAFLHAVHEENMTVIGGHAKPASHFEALRAAMPSGWRQLLVARLGGEPVAALLLLRYAQAVEYLTPVIRQAFRPQQPLSFLIWHGMLLAMRDGYRSWNWGGTWATQTSLHHFKAGWGALDQPYSYMVHAKPHALQALRRDRAAMAQVYPYFFTYPFHLLDSA